MKILRPLVALLALLTFAGCIGMPWRWGAQHASHRDYCTMAALQGWCSEGCSNQPSYCGDLMLISCSDLMCSYEAEDGSLVFRLRAAPSGVSAP